jgi:hypothetical protein
LDKARVTRDKAEKLDMFDLGLWNLDKESDKVERPDMFGLGVEHVRPEPLETSLEAEYV